VYNDFGNYIPYSDYLAAFGQIRAPIVFPTAAPNLEPRDDIWPTEPAARFFGAGSMGGAGSAALGLPTGEAQGRTVDQFPFRWAPVPEGALPYPGVALLRVHRHEAPEIEVAIPEGGRGLVLLCQLVAPDTRWCRGRIHDPDNPAGG
jgi:hypothetical protein